jgi:hypothetical protein
MPDGIALGGLAGGVLRIGTPVHGLRQRVVVL